jgi:hypothetical protein
MEGEIRYVNIEAEGKNDKGEGNENVKDQIRERRKKRKGEGKKERKKEGDKGSRD